MTGAEVLAAWAGAAAALAFLAWTYEIWGYRDFWERLGVNPVR
jgi:hypothetical protein